MATVSTKNMTESKIKRRLRIRIESSSLDESSPFFVYKCPDHNRWTYRCRAPACRAISQSESFNDYLCDLCVKNHALYCRFHFPPLVFFSFDNHSISDAEYDKIRDSIRYLREAPERDPCFERPKLKRQTNKK